LIAPAEREESVSRIRLSGRDPSTGRGVLLSIENGKIVLVESQDAADQPWISAGLVDLQVNGYRGFDVNSSDVSAKAVSQLARALLATGVTTFAPTVCTSAESDMVHRLRSISQACDEDPIAAACIPFIHVEGPHISPRDGYRGAHPLSFIRPPCLREFERWQAASNGMVGMVTISPHYDEAEDYITALVERGVHVSMGHTDASQNQIEAAVRAGARLSTHLGNGIALEIDRHPNPLWSQLAEDLLTASFIADGHHLPAETLKAMVRAKSLERSILVSDAVALAGMPPGRYNVSIGGRVELSADGRLSMEGASTLAGAAVPLITCLGRAVRMTGRPLAQVLTMATENPGRFAGGRGRLGVGARADIFRFHWNEETCQATVKDVWLAGEQMYAAG
jgi:N-acetylglucosamine-6-phosphate deacetylase